MPPDSLVIETAMAMQAMQMSMSHSVSVTKMALEAQEVAAQAVQQMLPPQITVPAGTLSDTYA